MRRGSIDANEAILKRVTPAHGAQWQEDVGFLCACRIQMSVVSSTTFADCRVHHLGDKLHSDRHRAKYSEHLVYKFGFIDGTRYIEIGLCVCVCVCFPF